MLGVTEVNCQGLLMGWMWGGKEEETESKVLGREATGKVSLLSFCKWGRNSRENTARRSRCESDTHQ